MRVSSVAPLRNVLSFATLGRYMCRDVPSTPRALVIQFSMNRAILRIASFLGTLRKRNFVELIGIEPTTSGLQSQRSPN